MKVDLRTVYRVLLECTAVQIIGHMDELVYPDLCGLTGDPNHIFMTMEYVDDDGLEYKWDFYEKHNQEVEIRDNKLVLMDDLGQEELLELLTTMDLNELFTVEGDM